MCVCVWVTGWKAINFFTSRGLTLKWKGRRTHTHALNTHPYIKSRLHLKLKWRGKKKQKKQQERMSHAGPDTLAYLGWLPVRRGSSSASGSGIAPVLQCPAKQRNQLRVTGHRKKNIWNFWFKQKEIQEDEQVKQDWRLRVHSERTAGCLTVLHKRHLLATWEKRQAEVKGKIWHLHTHIASFALLPSTVMVFTLKSTPKQ